MNEVKEQWFKKLMSRQYFLLFFLWSILTAININKAFHIDDTFYLKTAEYLSEHPLKPMSGMVNWNDNPTFIYTEYPPPLFPYIIAFYSSLFGWSEIALHLLLSLFTFSALFFFKKIAEFMNIRHKNLLLSIFAFCPVLIINQNLMLDVPLLSIILGMLYYVLKASKSSSLYYYIWAAVLLSIGSMIKYSILPLAIALIFIILIRQDYKRLIILLIPITTLVLWSVWNKFDYGSFHLTSKSRDEFNIEKFYAYITCLGSVSTFLITFLYATFRYKTTKIIIYSVLLIGILSVLLFYFVPIDPSKYLIYAFYTSGYLLVFLLLIHLWKLIGYNLKEYLLSDNFVILLFMGAMASFITLYAPFMATRHLLPVIPLILLFSHELFTRASKEINILTLVSTIILGMLLGISDWVYADYYRRMAKKIDLKTNQRIWSVGHWGWQWYTEKNGMQIYAYNEPGLIPGDYIVHPLDGSKQRIHEDLKLQEVEKKWEESTLLTFFSVHDFASLYCSDSKRPAWTLSKAPIDTIAIYKVEKGIEVNDMISWIKSNPEWLNSLRNQAIEMNISLDSILILNATWTLEQRRLKNTPVSK